MFNLNINSQHQQQLQSQAYQHYLHKQYAQSLELYKQALKQPTSSLIKQAFIQATIAILYIYMNNYQQAHKMLSDLSARIPSLNPKKNKSGRGGNKNNKQNNESYIQYLILAIKVEMSLALIELVNCHEQFVFQHVDNVLAYISQAENLRDRELLYRSAMKMLFGFGSFQQLSAQTETALSSIDGKSNREVYSTNISLQSNTSQILLSALAISQQLAGNLELAYQLSYKSYKLSESRIQRQIIPMIISCKHLLHLSEILNQSKTVLQLYRNELNTLMITPQIYGISEDTLFRNYEQKIKCGRGIVEIMMDYEKKEILAQNRNSNESQENEQIFMQMLHRKIVYKLQQSLSNIQNQEENNMVHNSSNPKYMSYGTPTASQPHLNRESIIRTLNCLSDYKNGRHILDLMKNSLFLQNIINEYKQKIETFILISRKHIQRYVYEELHMLPPRVFFEQFKDGQEVKNTNKDQKNTNNKKEINYSTTKNNAYINNISSNIANIKNNKRVQQSKSQSRIQSNNNSYREEIIKQQKYRKEVITYDNQGKGDPETNRNKDMEHQTKRQKDERQRQLQRKRKQEQLAQRERQLLERERKLQEQKYRQEQRLKQKEREIQSKKEKQLRMRREEKNEKEETEKYEEFRTRQDRVVNSQHLSNRDYKDVLAKERDLSKDQLRDLSQDNIQSRVNNPSDRSPRNVRRKFQHATVLTKSPRYTRDQPYSSSPNPHSISRVQKPSHNIPVSKYSQVNNSKILNHMNNVYVDNESSKLVNPIQDLYSMYDGDGNNISKVGFNDNSSGIMYYQNNNNLNRSRQKERGNDKSRQYKDERDIRSNINQKDNRDKSIDNERDDSKIGKKIEKDQKNDTTDNIMSVLKVQNSRTKQTYKQISNLKMGQQYNTTNTNNNIYMNNKNIRKEQSKLDQINRNNNNQGRETAKFISRNDEENNNEGDNSRYGNVTSGLSAKNQIKPIKSAINKSNQSQPNYQPNYQSNYQPNYLPSYSTNQGSNIMTNVNNPPLNVDNSINRSQDQLQFNNVDIVVQPANNPNNVSNISNVFYTSANKNNTGNINQNPKDIAPFSLIPSTSTNMPPQINPAPNSKMVTIKRTGSADVVRMGEGQRKQKTSLNSQIIRRFIKMCRDGQYFIKRHYSSDGGTEKFFMLSGDVLRWAVDQDKINTKYQQYKLRDIKGFAYGKVTDTFLKDCNKGLEPWLCFSLILQKRTLDLCCTEEIDPVIWIAGLSAMLNGQYITLKYPKKRNQKSSEQDIPISLYTPGRVLWARFLMKLKYKYLKPLKKNQRAPYKYPNAYAIIQWHKDFQKKQLSKMSKMSSVRN